MSPFKCIQSIAGLFKILCLNDSPCHRWVQLGFYNFQIVSHALHYTTSLSSSALLLLSEANKIDKRAQHSAAVFFVLLHLGEEKLLCE